MPVQRRFDFQLAGKGFMLSRNASTGRAWQRTGSPDTPSQRSTEAAKYGALPDVIDHPEVFNDWSGGFGHAYRQVGANTYHWGENFDARFPKQLVHCQLPTVVTSQTASVCRDIQRFSLVPPLVNASQWQQDKRIAGVIARGGFGYAIICPDTTGSPASPADAQVSVALRELTGKPVTVYSGILWPRLDSSGNPNLRLIGRDGGPADTWTLPYISAITESDRTWFSIGGSGNLRPAVRSATGDPVATANLTATLLIGGPNWPINDMSVVNKQLFIGLGNGLYVGDQGGSFTNIFPQLEQAGNPDNFRDLLPYANGILAQTVQGLFYYRAMNDLAMITEVPISGGRSPVQGYVRALGNCGPWVYAARWTGSATYLLASNDVLANIPHWHTLQKFAGNAVGRMLVDGITTPSGAPTLTIPPRMYIACDLDHAASAPLYAWRMPVNDDNPLLPQPVWSPNYIASARMDLGAVDWNAPGTPKIFRSCEVWADNLYSGTRYADIYYDVDQSGSFSLLGRAQLSPKTTIYFPSGEGSFTTGQSIELSLRSTTLSPAYSPVYRALVLRGALQPRSVDLITAVVRIADGIPDRQGSTMRSAATMIQELRDFGNPDAQGLQAHQLIDLSGATQWVKVLGRIDEQEVYQTGKDEPEIAATVRMAVLTYS